MPNTKSNNDSATKTIKEVPATKTASGNTNVIDLLTAEHKAVKTAFERYQQLVDNDAESKELTALAQQICMALSSHAQIEEEFLYPALRKAFDTAELINEAAIEHDTAKYLIDQILNSNRRDTLYDAKVKVLGEYIDHHVREEENEIFPKAKKLKIDMVALGEQIAARKAVLLEDAQPAETDKPAAEASKNKTIANTPKDKEEKTAIARSL